MKRGSEKKQRVTKMEQDSRDDTPENKTKISENTTQKTKKQHIYESLPKFFDKGGRPNLTEITLEIIEMFKILNLIKDFKAFN